MAAIDPPGGSLLVVCCEAIARPVGQAIPRPLVAPPAPAFFITSEVIFEGHWVCMQYNSLPKWLSDQLFR